MLRLFLRLYVILALGLAGAIWLVNYTFDELLPEANEVYNREAARGRPMAWLSNCERCRGRHAPHAWPSCNPITVCACSWCSVTHWR